MRAHVARCGERGHGHSHCTFRGVSLEAARDVFVLTITRDKPKFASETRFVSMTSCGYTSANSMTIKISPLTLSIGTSLELCR